jgi:TRAP-type mannitol/chloroaromatic compound transport system substrate-binding protein
MRTAPIYVLMLALALAGCSDDVQTSGDGEAQPNVRLRFQASFPAASLFYRNAQYFAERVATMSAGRLQIELLPPGAVVPAFEVLDAVHDGVLDGGHTGSAYWVGKDRTATLFGPAPGGPFGMDMLDYLGWIYEGDGLELYREFYQQHLRRNVVPIPMTFSGQQILGWFKTPVKSWEDLRGRKCRQTGITAEVFSKSGMQTVNIPGGEIVPAGQRGVIDCAEWVGPAEDMLIGFHTIWKYAYMPSIHEPATVAEILFNGRVWDSLPRSYQEIIKAAAVEATMRSRVLADRLNARALVELKEVHGINIERTPADILTKMLEAWDEIAAEEMQRNPFFVKVYESQRAYAGEVVPARRSIHVPYEFGANYYWPEKKQ